MKALADVINDDNWCQHAYCLRNGRRCAIGHIKAKWGFCPDSPTMRHLPYYADIEKLASVIRPGTSMPGYTVVSWNDADSRTAREVAELCAKAGV